MRHTLEHSLCTEQGWHDAGYGTKVIGDQYLWAVFLEGFANLQRWAREREAPFSYSVEDEMRFWGAFKKGAYSRIAADTKQVMLKAVDDWEANNAH